MKAPKINKKTINKINRFKQAMLDAFNTSFTTAKILGGGIGGAYLIVDGISATNVAFMGIGAVIAAYSIIVLVSTAHIATKSARA